MNNPRALRIAAFMGALAVALGAFGAHSLRPVLTQHNTQSVWEKAVFYHFIHVMVLLILAMRRPLLKGPWFSFLAGIVIFSGSLYLLAVGGGHWLGYFTPVGGLSFLVGWIWLMCSSAKLGDTSLLNK